MPGRGGVVPYAGGGVVPYAGGGVVPYAGGGVVPYAGGGVVPYAGGVVPGAGRFCASPVSASAAERTMLRQSPAPPFAGAPPVAEDDPVLSSAFAARPKRRLKVLMRDLSGRRNCWRSGDAKVSSTR